MADATLAVTEGTGKLLDTESLTVGGLVVQRQRVEVVGSIAAEVATVKNVSPGVGAYGLTVRMPGPTGQDFGAIATQEVNSVYISGKSRVSTTTNVSNAAVTAATGIPFIAGSVGKVTYLMHLAVAASVAMQVFIRDGTVVGQVLYLAYCAGAAASSVTIAAPTGTPLCLSSINNGLFLDCSANGTIYISAGWVQA